MNIASCLWRSPTVQKQHSDGFALIRFRTRSPQRYLTSAWGRFDIFINFVSVVDVVFGFYSQPQDETASRSVPPGWCSFTHMCALSLPTLLPSLEHTPVHKSLLTIVRLHRRERRTSPTSASRCPHLERGICSSDAQAHDVCNISSHAPRAWTSCSHRLCHRLLCWYIFV